MHYRGKYWHHSGIRHYSAYCRYWLFPYVPTDFTCTKAGNRHYSTGTIETTAAYMHIPHPAKKKNAHTRTVVTHVVREYTNVWHISTTKNEHANTKTDTLHTYGTIQHEYP